MSNTHTTTFVNRYKPYFIKDFNLEDNQLLLYQTLLSMHELNILIVGAECSGKTTLMNAIIRDYYGLSPKAAFPEYNIMLINNLKEQGIQFFRNDMKTFCQSQSNIQGKKKIIMVDDIDMINEQSQQVFRNYIDKYSNNVQLIASCTNVQKVNESLQSRLHITKINKMKREHLEEIMNKIINAEGLYIEEEAKTFMLNVCGGAVRVLINYLEKIFIYQWTDKTPVTLEKANYICSNISFLQFNYFITAIKERNLEKAICVLNNIYEYGYSVIDILDYFFKYLKHTDILTDSEKYRVLPYLCKYITIFHKVHEDPIELAFFANNLIKII
jgi:DNA polymerase III delta prime subunit